MAVHVSVRKVFPLTHSKILPKIRSRWRNVCNGYCNVQNQWLASIDLIQKRKNNFSLYINRDFGTNKFDSDKPYQVQTCCAKWTRTFEEKGIEEPQQSIEYILSHVLGQKTVSTLTV